MPPVAVSVTPASATLSDGSQQQQFTANVINAINTAVTWTISPSGAGTISATGLYAAPANIASQQTVTVTATSQTGPDQVGLSYDQAYIPPYSLRRNADQADTAFNARLPSTTQRFRTPIRSISRSSSIRPTLPLPQQPMAATSPVPPATIFSSVRIPTVSPSWTMSLRNTTRSQARSSHGFASQPFRTPRIPSCMCSTETPALQPRSRAQPVCGTATTWASGTLPTMADNYLL